jgi:hypothetical protein
MEHWIGWLEAVGVLVTAIATIVLAFVTKTLARETKRLAEIGQQPQVVFSVEPSDFEMNFLYNHVQNVGTAPAYDIRISFSPSLEFKNTQNATRAPFEKISVLKPGQRLSSFICSYDELETKSFIVTTYWRKSPAAKEEESLSYQLNLSDFEQMLLLKKQSIEESLERIAKSLGNLESGFKRLKVDTFDDEDRQAERQSQEEARQNRRVGRDGPPQNPSK